MTNTDDITVNNRSRNLQSPKSEMSSDSMQRSREKQLEEIIAKRDFELSEAKEMLSRMQKMETLAFLAAGISHDLQNMNSVIMSTLTSFEHNTQGNNNKITPKGYSYINLAKQANSTSSELVRKLNKLFEARQSSFYDFDLVDIIDHIVEICRYTFPSSIKTYCIKHTENAFFHGDRVDIEQAILNICINASHAMTLMRKNPIEGGVLKITLEPGVTISLDNDKDIENERFWKICISDNGVGMNTETIEKIFQPMFTTKEKGIGTGLGLHIMKDIITAHGGLIDVNSQVGKGTEFQLYIPEKKRDVLLLNNY